MTKKWLYGKEGYENCLALRMTVFVDEQGYPKDLESDEYENTAWHYIIKDGDKVVATGRIVDLGAGTWKLGRIAVEKEKRGTGLGAKTVTALISKAKTLGANRLLISAQTYAVGFYEKFGFAVCSKEFMDENLPHVDMECNLQKKDN